MNWETLILAVMAGVIGLGAAEYWRVRRELSKRMNEETRDRERARERAERLVEGARDKAVEIMREAEVLSEKQSEGLERRLRQAAREGLKDYTAELERMAREVQKGAWSEVSDFKKTLEIGTVELEQTVGKRIAQEYDKAREELEKYKQDKKARLDEQAVGIIKELGRRVLGKVIPAEEHKKLILDALKEVEAENGF